MAYEANALRYDQMIYRACGKSGLKLPAIALGLWRNFGFDRPLDLSRDILHAAFDSGITHFDLANNYGGPQGAAEQNFGILLKRDFLPYRDELVISSKAGYRMWKGPYGDGGSRKYLISSIDQSLKRMGLDYVDIFYHHKPDRDTPIEESMMALDQIVRSGKALYVGISNYGAEETREAVRILAALGTPCLIHQPSYSMLYRWLETEKVIDAIGDCAIGCICFSPLSMGKLTNKTVNDPVGIDDKVHKRLIQLNEIATDRGQSLAQLSLAWVLRDKRVTTALIGASRIEHIADSVAALNKLDFTPEELKRIDEILA